MAELPTGTVTFLITDLEGSTRLWEQEPGEEMRRALARHDAVFDEAVTRNRGVVYDRAGDGVLAVFESAVDAVAAALDAQLVFAADRDAGLLRARIGLHSDEGRFRAPGRYVNRPINRASRLMAVAHGGQTVLSGATAALARDALPEGVHLVDLGPHRLKDLAEPVQVFQLAHRSLLDAFPPLRSLESAPGNLPRQVTTFVGREREVGMLSDLVRERPLVTLTGVGGVGKTRLALQVAAEIVLDFPDGAWLCGLAAVLDPGAVWEAVGNGVQAPRQNGRATETSVVEYLGAKRALLVLDNCEHLLDAAAEVADAVARECPGVTVLATSREGLAVAGEQIVAVRSLGLPSDADSVEVLESVEAVRLFCDRAHDVNREFELTDRNAAAVAQLCRRLDGIPLAIELAAARARSLSPEDLVSRLDQRFKLLTRGSRAALERHQTLRNTIDWSYNLLTPQEQEGLCRLSVFVGGCTLDASEAILGDDAIDLLSQLVEKSLVIADEDEGGTRYRLLETIRQYAQDRLDDAGDAGELRRRHAECYISLVDAALPGLRGREQIATATRLARDTENFRAVLDWAVETGSADHALRLLAPIAMTNMSIGWSAMGWSAAACEIPGGETHPCFPHVCAMAALDAVLGSEPEKGDVLVARAERAERELGIEEQWLHAARGAAATFRGDWDAAQEEGEAWTASARQTGDPYDIAHALGLLGSALASSDNPRAIPVLEETIEVARRGGIPSILTIGLMMLGIALPPEDSQRALALLAEAAELTLALGDRYGAAQVLSMRSRVALDSQDWSNALATADASMQELLALGENWVFTGAVLVGAWAFAGLGELEPATVLSGFVATRTDSLRDRDHRGWDAVNADIDMRLGRTRADELRSRGAAMDGEDVVAYLHEEATRVLADHA